MVTKADVELELQTTLPTGYTADYITALSATAESIIKSETRRASFTGNAADLYARACLCWVISTLVGGNPSLSKGSISSIKEGDSQITFGNGRGVATYTTEYTGLVAALKINSVGYNYTYTNEYTFYDEDDTAEE